MKNLQKQNIIFLCFDAKNGCKTWDEMKTSYNRNDTSLFKRRQIVNSFPKTQKEKSIQRNSKGQLHFSIA